MDKTGNIVIVIGKKSFTAVQLIENAQAALAALVKSQPAGFSGGRFIKSITMSASMSPGVAVDLKPYSAAVVTA
jgi:ribosomal protein L1